MISTTYYGRVSWQAGRARMKNSCDWWLLRCFTRIRQSARWQAEVCCRYNNYAYICTYNRGPEVTVRFLVIHPLILFYGIPLHTHLIWFLQIYNLERTPIESSLTFQICHRSKYLLAHAQSCSDDFFILPYKSGEKHHNSDRDRKTWLQLVHL